MNRKQHAAIIFTDYKDFSKLSNEENIKVSRLNDQIKEQVISKFDYITCNTWGDAFFVCFSSCTDAAQCALDMRHMLRTYNWTKYGFSRPLQARIGIHFAEVNLINSLDELTCTVAGSNISAGSRIEPVTDPDKIFCSSSFKMGLDTSFDDRFSVQSLGVRELAKDFGKMELYELNWSHEAQNVSPISTSATFAQPKITPSFPSLPPNDLDKKEFVKKGYAAILQCFQEGAQLAPQQMKHLQLIIEPITFQSFVAEMYLEGTCKHKMKIWIGGYYDGNSICSSEGPYIDLHSTSSFNDQLDLAIEDNQLFFANAIGHLAFISDESKIDLKKMTAEQAAQFFWNKFIHHASL